MIRKISGAAVLVGITAAIALSGPAGADHGPGLQQSVQGLLQGGTITFNAGGVASFCWDVDGTGTDFQETCTDHPISQQIDELGLSLAYTLARTEAHLPNVAVVTGVPAACTDANGIKHPGVVIDLGRGSFVSFNSMTLKIGGEEKPILTPGANGKTIDPGPARFCLNQVAAT